MSERLRITVPERIGDRSAFPAKMVHHLMYGPWLEDASFQPILCSPENGIVLPYRDKAPESNVCLTCRRVEGMERRARKARQKLADPGWSRMHESLRAVVVDCEEAVRQLRLPGTVEVAP